MIFGMAFMFGLLAVMLFLHFRKVRSGEDSLIRRWVNAAGEIGPVVEWLEADTMRVKLPNETVAVRLNAVDTPGIQQPGGEQALSLVKDLVSNQPVRVLEFRRNQAGEVIGEVYNSENISLNEELMKAGWAWYYEPDAPNNPYYRDLNKQAIDHKTGLWSLGNPEPPWNSISRNTSP